MSFVEPSPDYAAKLATHYREVKARLSQPPVPQRKPPRIVWEMTQRKEPPVKVEEPIKVDDPIIAYLNRHVTVLKVLSVVARRYGISKTDMLSMRRTKRLILPRQIAMYLARELTLRSLPEIGRCFYRDHTTVLHAGRKITALIETDASVRLSVAALKAELKGGQD